MGDIDKELGITNERHTQLVQIMNNITHQANSHTDVLLLLGSREDMDVTEKLFCAYIYGGIVMKRNIKRR